MSGTAVEGGPNPSERERRGGTGPDLTAALWVRLQAARTAEEVVSAWLPLLCGTFGVRVHAAIADLDSPPVEGIPEEERPARRRVVWPDLGAANPVLGEALDHALVEGTGAVRPGAGPARAVLSWPVLAGAGVTGAVAIEIADPGTRAEKERHMRTLQWGAAWLREALASERLRASERRVERLGRVLALGAGAIEADGPVPAARRIVTEIAEAFGCERVAIGLSRQQRVRVLAISHVANVHRRMGLVRRMAAAMEEALDQRMPVAWPEMPADGAPPAAGATRELAREARADQLLVLPLYAKDRWIGAVTLERTADAPFSQADIDTLEAALALVAPVLEEKRAADRWLVTQGMAVLRAHLGRIVGPGHPRRKAAMAVLVALAAFAAFAHGPHRVTAEARLDGIERRAVVAPYDGFVMSTAHRAGDSVEDGATLARLDDSDLRLQAVDWEAELRRRQLEVERALSERNPLGVRTGTARLDQARARLDLARTQLARAELRAPFDGTVVAGDLSGRVGGAVNRGEVLFEIAPFGGYRVVMQADERDVGEIRAGQPVELVLVSFPKRSFGIEVERILPVAEYADGRTSFPVIGKVEDPDGLLRPGMHGVAKITIGERRLVWIWTRSLVDWWRMTVWRWGG